MHHFTRQPAGEHILSHIDPRIKLAGAIGLLAMVISSGDCAFPLAAFFICTLLCLAMKVRPGSLALRYAEPGFIIAMVVMLKLFFSGHTQLFAFNIFGVGIAGYREGLMEGALIASRIAGAVAVVTALGFATPFTELMAALSWLRVPGTFVEIALFAWRYLFLLSDDAKTIYDAQKNRLGYSGYRRGLRSFGTLTGALIIKAFDNSRGVATAMTQRGYDGRMPTLMHKPFKKAEMVYAFLFFAVMAIMRIIV
jgi:cobalt/nickel transport system permease protein